MDKVDLKSGEENVCVAMTNNRAITMEMKEDRTSVSILNRGQIIGFLKVIFDVDVLEEK